MPLCAYCNHRPADTFDHVLARAFYSKRTDQKVTVPSCQECNRKRGDGGPRDMSMEEEYMRNTLCLDGMAQEHPVVKDLLPRVYRSYEHSKNFRDALLKVSGPIAVLDQDEYLVEKPAFKIDWPRIYRVVRKLTKGLYFLNSKEPLPVDYDVMYLVAKDREQFHLLQNIFFPDVTNALIMLGEDSVFQYFCAKDANDPHITSWLMLFYNSLGVLAITLPKTQFDQQVTEYQKAHYYMPLSPQK